MKNRFEKKHYLLFTGLALFLGASATVHNTVAPFQVHEWSSLDDETPEEAKQSYKITYSLTRSDVEAGDEDCELCGSKTLTLENLPLDDNEKTIETITKALGLSTSRKLVQAADEDEEDEYIALEEPSHCEDKKELRRLRCNARELIKQSKELNSDENSEDLLMSFYKDFIEDDLQNYLNSDGDRDREDAVEFLANLQSKMKHSNTEEIKERLSVLLKDSLVSDAQKLQSIAQRAKSHWDRSNQLNELVKKAQTPHQMQLLQIQSKREQDQAKFLEQEVRGHYYALQNRFMSTDRQVRSVLNRALGEDLSSMDIMNFYDTPFSYPVSSMLLSLQADPLSQIDLLMTPSLATPAAWIARSGISHGRYSESSISQYTGSMPEFTSMGTVSIFDSLGLTLPTPSSASPSASHFILPAPSVGPSAALKAVPSAGRGRGI